MSKVAQKLANEVEMAYGHTLLVANTGDMALASEFARKAVSSALKLDTMAAKASENDPREEGPIFAIAAQAAIYAGAAMKLLAKEKNVLFVCQSRWLNSTEWFCEIHTSLTEEGAKAAALKYHNDHAEEMAEQSGEAHTPWGSLEDIRDESHEFYFQVDEIKAFKAY